MIPLATVPSVVPVYTHTAALIGSTLMLATFLAMLSVIVVSWLRHR